MRREFGQKLVERGPSWFRMWDGFAHGDGWFDILWMLNEDLEPLAAEAEKAPAARSKSYKSNRDSADFVSPIGITAAGGTHSYYVRLQAEKEQLKTVSN